MKISSAFSRFDSLPSLRRAFRWLPCAIALLGGNLSAQDRLTETPIFIQDGFGPGGTDLPDDGTVQCVTTAMSMNLAYLANTGYTQLLSSNATFAEQLNLVRVMCGLSGTTNLNGTNNSGLQQGIETYLAAKGIANYTLDFVPANADFSHPVADVPWFQNVLANPNSVALLAVGWFTEDTNNHTYSNSGGHGMAVVGADATTGYLTINNPAPSSLLNAPDVVSSGQQTLHTIPFTGSDPTNLPYPPYIQYDPSQPGSTLGPESGDSHLVNLAVIWTGVSLTLDPGEKPGSGWTPATWTLSAANHTIDTYGGDLTVEAPIGVSNVGFVKQGIGTLLLKRENQSTGNNEIDNGTIQSLVASGSPLGSGSVKLVAGTLSLTPQTATPGAVTLTLASASGSGISITRHGVLALDAGVNPSLTVSAGDVTRAASSNLVVDEYGTFVLAPAHGLAGLGSIERFLVAGTGTLPSTDTILGPNLVARDNDSPGSGTFLRVGTGNELLPATYTESASVPISSVPATAVYDVTTTQTIAGSATAKVSALRVEDATVGGGAGTFLDVGPNVAQQGAGIILNNGIISAGVLRFGASDGYIYASLGAGGDATTAGGRIDSEITGSGALTTYGPGVLELTSNNSYTGTTYVQSGTLRAANLAGSATGAGDVDIAATGTLEISGHAGRVQGSVKVGDGTLTLLGGSVGGHVTVDAKGHLAGYGTIEGDFTNAGTIGAGPQTGTLTLQGKVTLSGNGVWEWRLDRLVDDSTGQAGTDWNTLNFQPGAGDTITLNGFSLSGDFSLVNPDGGDPFWGSAHQWTIMTSSVDLFDGGNSFNDYWGFKKFASGSFTWEDVAGGTEIQLKFTPVPEPSGMELLGLAAMVGGISILRHRRKPRPV